MLVFKIFRHFNIKDRTESRSYFEDLDLDRYCMNFVFNISVRDCTEIIYVVRSLLFLQMMLENSVCAAKTSRCLFVTKTCQQMTVKEAIADYSEIYAENPNVRCKIEGDVLNIKAVITNNNHCYRLTNDVSYVSYHCSTLHSPKQRGVGTKFRTCRR